MSIKYSKVVTKIHTQTLTFMYKNVFSNPFK